MDLDILFVRYFGTSEPDGVGDDVLAAGLEQLAIDFAVEQEPSRRFALWTMMETFGTAPSPEKAFKDRAMQDAAHAYRKLAWRVERG
ncbi:MAG: hypothetical protein ABW128_00045 [Rhizorhabdus sp.]